MTLIELHVFTSGWRISINPEQVSDISDMEGHAGIRRSDGGTVEVRESYEQVIAKIKGDKL